MFFFIISSGFLIMLAFFLVFLASHKAGRNDQINPETLEAVKGLSPAAMRMILKADFDSDCLLAGMIDASITGSHHILWKKEGFSFRLSQPEKIRDLPGDEKAAFTYSNGHPVQKLWVSNERNKFTDRAEARMSDYLHRQLKNLFSPRKQWIQGTYLLSALVFTIGLIMGSDTGFFGSLSYGAILILGLIGLTWVVEAILDGWSWFYGFRDLLIVFIGFTGAGLCDYMANPEVWYLPWFLPFLVLLTVVMIYLPRHTREGWLWARHIQAYREELEEASEDIFSRDDSLVATRFALGIDTPDAEFFSNYLSQQKVMNGPEGRRAFYGRFLLWR